MELKLLSVAAFILLVVLCSLIRSSAAKPASYTSGEDYYVPVGAIDRVDDDYYSGAAPLTNYRLNQLRRGYYYVDDGYITAVPSSPFAPLHSSAESSHRRTGGTRYKPLVHVRQTRTKRKKLFVPNLFG